MKKSIAIVGLMLAMTATLTDAVWAAGGSPVGLWKTSDEQTGQPKALIRITENDGELTGRVEKLFKAPDEDQNPKCTKCEGVLAGQPIIGLPILSGLKKDGDGYSGGVIVDPSSGKVYKMNLSVTEDGSKMNVRGYIGLPLLGRTQVWVRE